MEPSRTESAAHPRPGQMRLIAVLYGLTLAGALALIAGTFLAPWLASRGSDLATGIYRAYSPLCHQIPSRCFHLLGHPLAVCGRCLGVYSGFLAGTLAYPLARGMFNTELPRRRFLFLMSLPLALDALGNILHLWDTGIGIRFLAGLLWGLILPFYFLAGLASFVSGKLAILRPSK